MTHHLLRIPAILGLAVAGWLLNGGIDTTSGGSLMAAAEARVGRPVTPVSYAGVGVLLGAGAGQVGVGYSGGVGVNLGGPVNRVGVR